MGVGRRVAVVGMAMVQRLLLIVRVGVCLIGR
jgi:hypothetical protein